MKGSNNFNRILTPEESVLVADEVAQAEQLTSAEIKVVVARYCWDDIRAKAARIFKKLELDKTKERNCVLVLLVVTNREFLIYGDIGIHEKVGQEFWDDVRDLMSTLFKEGRFAEGLCVGVEMAGEKLAAHFPYHGDDKDEISNEVVQA